MRASQRAQRRRMPAKKGGIFELLHWQYVILILKRRLQFI
jgi:hypothetical protein